MTKENGKYKEVKAKEILKLLRKNSDGLFQYPSGWRVLFFKRIDFDQAEEFDVQVRCQYVNYNSLIRSLYDADDYGMIKTRPFESEDFSYVSAIKELMQQLQDDGYLKLGKQQCGYHTEYGKKLIPDGDGGLDEVYIDAKKFFSDEQKELLETSIILTTKGKSRFVFWKDKIISEPLGLLAFVVSIVAFAVSLFK